MTMSNVQLIKKKNKSYNNLNIIMINLSLVVAKIIACIFDKTVGEQRFYFAYDPFEVWISTVS